MKEIILKMDSPKEAAQIVSVLFQNGFKPTEAKINYSLRESSSIRLSRVTSFPLILTGTLNGHETRVAITPLVAGSHCEGSYALRKILKEANFYFEERDLFTIRRFNPDTGRLTLTFTQK